MNNKRGQPRPYAAKESTEQTYDSAVDTLMTRIEERVKAGDGFLAAQS